MTNTPPPTTSQQPPLSNQQQPPQLGYGYQYPPQPYGQPTGVPPGQYPPPQQGYYGQPHPPQQGYYGGYQQQYGQPMYQQYPPQQQGYYGLVPPQQPTGNTQPPPTGQPNTVPPQQYPHQQGYYGQTPQQGYYGQQYPPQQLPPQQPYGQPQQPYGQYPPQTGVPQQVVQPQGQYPPQMQQQPYGQQPPQGFPPQTQPQSQQMELPKTIPQKPSPRNLTYQKVARLGEEEDCGEFKFDNLYAMVVHQKRNWLLIPDRRQIHIFDLNTKKNLKSLNCYHLWGSGSMPPTDIDIDYNDDTFYVIADYSLYKLNFEGDLLMKLHSGNREEKGMKITPRYIAVNQSDSSVLCATEGSGTQIIQMMTKDGKGGKVISEDSQGRSRYYCFNSVCYSGYGDQFYIGDSSTIYLIDSTGKILKTHQVEATPQALRVDHYTGCLILSDYHKCIRFVNMEGYSKSFAEEGGTSCCEVSDQLGELYVAFHDRVEIYKSGEAHLVAQAGIRPLPITQAPKVSVSRNMKRSAILGDEEDCGEFKFNGLIAMVVHQTKKHLLVAERLNIQIFDLTTKRHIKTIKVPVGDCSSIYDIDVDYTEDTIVVATTALYKFSYEGDILWKVDYHNREQKGFQFIPRYIAVNQKDSSIMCLTEGCGTQIIQMCTKDGQSGKVISEDSQGRSRYYCFCSVLYSGNEDQFYIGDSNTIYLINSKGRILKTHKAGAHTDAMRLDRATGNILLNDYHNSVRLVNLEGYDKVLVDDVPIQAVDILDQTGELFVGSYDQVFIYKGQ